MKEYILPCLLSFALTAILMPAVKKLLRLISVKQTILTYVEEHKTKNGTLTMGGVCFAISTLLVPFIFLSVNTNWLVCLLSTIFFGLVGFLDDFLKIKFKQNLGLRPYQKIIGQLGISVIFAFYIYFNVGSTIFIPFTTKTIDVGFLIIPLVIIVLIAATNSANLLDGMDGLLSTTSVIYLLGFIVITTILSSRLYLLGETGAIISSTRDICLLGSVIIGGLLAFLIFNTNPASIFMGDVGSLLIGGFIGCSACLLGQVLLLPLLAIMFVWTTLSVIIQVVVFKMKRRRVFKMSPFHHHLQMSGLSEPKIVYIYALITGIVSLICIFFYL